MRDPLPFLVALLGQKVQGWARGRRRKQTWITLQSVLLSRAVRRSLDALGQSIPQTSGSIFGAANPIIRVGVFRVNVSSFSAIQLDDFYRT